jgi:hypothetical protein
LENFIETVKGVLKVLILIKWGTKEMQIEVVLPPKKFNAPPMYRRHITVMIVFNQLHVSI